MRASPLQAEDFLSFLAWLSPAHREHITWLALECFTNPFECIESNTLCLVLLQAPESRMTYSSFFGQPIEGPLMLLQQLIHANSNHSDPDLPKCARYLSHLLNICL